MIKDIAVKVRSDVEKEAYGVMENVKDYVDTEPGKYFHVIFSAVFPKDFDGKLRVEISHPKNGFKTYHIVNNPPKEVLAQIEEGDALCFGSPGIPISKLLGWTYRPVMGQIDYVNVKLFLDNHEIVNKDFPVRGTFS